MVLVLRTRRPRIHVLAMACRPLSRTYSSSFSLDCDRLPEQNQPSPPSSASKQLLSLSGSGLFNSLLDTSASTKTKSKEAPTAYIKLKPYNRWFQHLCDQRQRLKRQVNHSIEPVARRYSYFWILRASYSLSNLLQSLTAISTIYNLTHGWQTNHQTPLPRSFLLPPPIFSVRPKSMLIPWSHNIPTLFSKTKSTS